MTFASASRTDFRSCCCVRICRRPPMTEPTRPRSVSVSFCCTQCFPAWDASPNKALAALQREPTTCMMSRTKVTRFHGLKSLVARRHRPRAPSSRTTKGLRCWGSRRSASALISSITASFVRTRLASRRTCWALGASSAPFSCCRRARCFRIDQKFRERFGRPWLGIDGVADPHQRFLLLLPLLARAQLRFELDCLRLDHRDALAVKTHHQELALSCLRGHRPLGIEALIILRCFLRHLHQDALGDLEVEELLKPPRTLLEGVFDLEQGHPFLQEVRIAPLREVDLFVEWKDPGLPGRAVARPGHRELAEEREVVPPPQRLLPRQDHAVSTRGGRSHIAG